MRSMYFSFFSAPHPLYRLRQLERGVSQTAKVSAKSSSGCFCAYQPAMWRTNCARERHRLVFVAIGPAEGAEELAPLGGLVELVGVVEGVSGFVAQVHHDLARVLEVVHLALEPLQFRVGEVEGNADHRLARRASPLVGEVALSGGISSEPFASNSR